MQTSPAAVARLIVGAGPLLKAVFPKDEGDIADPGQVFHVNVIMG